MKDVVLDCCSGWDEHARVLDVLLRGGFCFDRDVGWTSNYLWGRDVPCLYRSNSKCEDERFWNAFADMLIRSNMNCSLLFHDNHAGWSWCKSRKLGRFLRIASNSAAIECLRRYACWGKKWSHVGEKNDNYYAIDSINNVVMVFAHDGDFLCFSNDLLRLERALQSFVAHRLVASILQV